MEDCMSIITDTGNADEQLTILSMDTASLDRYSGYCFGWTKTAGLYNPNIISYITTPTDHQSTSHP
jgi:hypothetical protein